MTLVLGIALIALLATAGRTVVNSRSAHQQDRKRITFAAEGLRPAGKGSLCAGSYELPAPGTCTHGPDAAPAGLQVGTDVAPVTPPDPEPRTPARELSGVPSDAEIVRDEGGTALTPSAPALVPDPAPGEAAFVMGVHEVACDGDGRTGKRVQVLYLHEFGTPSRYTQYVGSIQAWAAGVDAILDQSAGETGGSRHVRFVTTPQCRVDVAEVQVPDGSLHSFTGNISALEKLGYNRTDRKYLVFADAHAYCGIGTFIADSRPGSGNRNNGGPSYGRVDSGCWGAAMATHELVHTLGAVLRGSPHSDGTGHCTDDYDLLCDVEQGAAAARTACPQTHEQRLDCNHDDYFNTNPKAGSYLVKAWNVAQSEFLLQSDGGNDLPQGVPQRPLPPLPGKSAGKASASASSASASPATVSPTAAGADDAVPPGAGPGAEPGKQQGGEPGAEPGAEPGGEPNNGAEQPDSGAVPSQAPGAPAGEPGDEPQKLTPLPAKRSTVPTEQAAAPVQAAVEARDPTSTSVSLNWSAASSNATYQVWVDDAVIANAVVSTRARLIGLRPGTKYTVTVRSAAEHYRARVGVQTLPVARPAQNSWFLMTNSLTGGAADLYAARKANGTPAVLNGAEGGAQQQWRLTPSGDGSFVLQSQATGKCVSPQDGNPVAGAPLVQVDCTADGSQRWLVQYTDHGFSLVTTVGGLVVGVGTQRFGEHRVLVLQQANRSRQQSWTALPG